MSTPSNNPRGVRPFYWSVLREVWENRAIYIAPLIVAGVVLFGFMISTVGLPHRRRAALMLPPEKRYAAIAEAYDVVGMFVIVTAFLVGIFYCLDALYGERRDRSILFWKSLPVSDRTTVLAKAFVPMAVLPAVIFPIILFTRFLMMIWSTIVLLPSGLAGSTWTNYHFVTQSVVLLYSLIVIALWHAPIYGWLLMVSACVKRAAFLWAILPFLALGILEKIAFGTALVPFTMQYRLFSGMEEAFALNHGGTVRSLSQLTPGRFVTGAGLWIGLAFAATFIAIAMRLRRDRAPI